MFTTSVSWWASASVLVETAFDVALRISLCLWPISEMLIFIVSRACLNSSTCHDLVNRLIQSYSSKIQHLLEEFLHKSGLCTSVCFFLKVEESDSVSSLQRLSLLSRLRTTNDYLFVERAGSSFIIRWPCEHSLVRTTPGNEWSIHNTGRYAVGLGTEETTSWLHQIGSNPNSIVFEHFIAWAWSIEIAPEREPAGVVLGSQEFPKVVFRPGKRSFE